MVFVSLKEGGLLLVYFYFFFLLCFEGTMIFRVLFV